MATEGELNRIEEQERREQARDDYGAGGDEGFAGWVDPRGGADLLTQDQYFSAYDEVNGTTPNNTPTNGSPCDAADGSKGYWYNGTCMSGNGGGGSGGSGGSGGGGLPDTTRTPSSGFSQIPGAPEFNAPGLNWTEEFGNLTAQQLLENDPGYQFRLDEGRKALERSAAAGGYLRTGGTLKDILGYGQDYAAKEYAAAFDRAKTGYDTRFGTAKDMYSAEFEGDQAEYAPGYLTWQKQADATTRQQELELQKQWEKWFYDNLSAADYGDFSLRGSGL